MSLINESLASAGTALKKPRRIPSQFFASLNKRIKRVLGFVDFTFSHIQPKSAGLRVLAAKTLHNILGKEIKINLAFRFLHSNLLLDFQLQDLTQYSYLFNIFYAQPFRITRRISERPVIIDAGANIGMTAIYFLCKYPAARIFAFEPSPNNTALFQANLQGQVAEIKQCAVWDQSEPLPFHFSACPRYHSAYWKRQASQTVNVQAIRLDEWLEKRGLEKIDVLKLNVEGAELRVLKGLGHRLKDVSVIVGELHPEVVDTADFLSTLRRAGFDIVRLEENATLFEAHNMGPHGNTLARRLAPGLDPAISR